MQTSYGCIFLKKSSVAAINITLGVPGRRADKTLLVVTRHPIRHEIRHQIRKFTQKSCRPKMGDVAAPKILPTEN